MSSRIASFLKTIKGNAKEHGPEVLFNAFATYTLFTMTIGAFSGLSLAHSMNAERMRLTPLASENDKVKIDIDMLGHSRQYVDLAAAGAVCGFIAPCMWPSNAIESTVKISTLRKDMTATKAE